MNAIPLAIVITSVTTVTSLYIQNMKNTEYQYCKMKDGVQGICLPEYQCYDNHTVAFGGSLVGSDYRIGPRECKTGEWCCTSDDIQAAIPPHVGNMDGDTDGKDENVPISGDVQLAPSGRCLISAKMACPWCVGLYRKDGNPKLKTTSGRFCGGIMLNKHVVMTAAVCVQPGLWVQVPGAVDSKRQYTVRDNVTHPRYNAAKRLFNLALLTLNEEVEWQQKSPCIGFRTDLQDGLQCYSPIFRSDDHIDVLPIDIAKSHCDGNMKTVESACARATTGSACKVSNGFPVFCPYEDLGYLIAGLVKQPCHDEVQWLTSISHTIISDWMKEEFGSIKLDADQFSASPS